MLKIQQYIKAESLQEAYEYLQKNRNNQIIAGMLWLKMEDRNIPVAIDLERLGLDEIIDRLQESPEVFRDARSRELEDIGQQLLPRVRAGIGGTGRIQNLQDVYMGSGKG